MRRIAHRFRAETEVFARCADCRHIVPLEDMASRGPVHLEDGKPHFKYRGNAWPITIKQYDQCCKGCRTARDRKAA